MGSKIESVSKLTDHIKSFPYNQQKQSFADIVPNRYSQKFRNIHRKTPVLESLFSKVAGLEVSHLIKKRLQQHSFSCKYCKIFRNNFFIEDLQWLPLNQHGSIIWHWTNYRNSSTDISLRQRKSSEAILIKHKVQTLTYLDPSKSLWIKSLMTTMK